MKQTFTIFHTVPGTIRTAAGLTAHDHVTLYPGYGADPDAALADVMDAVAKAESTFAETPAGEWEIFGGSLRLRPVGVHPARPPIAA